MGATRTNGQPITPRHALRRTYRMGFQFDSARLNDNDPAKAARIARTAVALLEAAAANACDVDERTDLLDRARTWAWSATWMEREAAK